jgi:predicted Ser/Thr protein kinase
MTKHTLLQKRARLDRAKSRLKAEFFGIDGVIDQLVDAISSWFLTPELQDRPMVVNLWGLTGVGKSSLVMRLSELLDLSKDTYVFDLGEQQSGNSPLQSAEPTSSSWMSSSMRAPWTTARPNSMWLRTESSGSCWTAASSTCPPCSTIIRS